MIAVPRRRTRLDARRLRLRPKGLSGGLATTSLALTERRTYTNRQTRSRRLGNPAHAIAVVELDVPGARVLDTRHVAIHPAAIERGSLVFYFFVPSAISSRRPLTLGGAGIVTSRTPSRKLALACSVIAPSGSGMAR